MIFSNLGSSYRLIGFFLTRPSSAEPRSSTRFWKEEEAEDSFEKVAIALR